MNAIYCRSPFVRTFQGLDLFLDLLGDLSFSESVVESSVDILQVSASASTWGSSSLGLSGPVKLKKLNSGNFHFSILGRDSRHAANPALDAYIVILSLTYSSSDGGSLLLDMISSSSGNTGQDVGLVVSSTS